MKTAVLLLVYNRPNQTKQVLKRLQECGVSRIYISADGPKNSKDKILTGQVREVLKDFESMVEASLFSDRNLGCKQAVIQGINWFFSQVDEGIMLEDDCLPSKHFFPFASDMLARYREVENIKMIGGNNPLGEWHTSGGHHFSRMGTVWGWATWKNKWQDFEVELPKLRSFLADNGFEKQFGPTDLAEQRKALTLKSVSGEIDTWDYQWNAHILMENGLAVIPEKNLVENIGFDTSATNDSSISAWINNSVATDEIFIAEKPILVDCEFEMEWHLARSANARANRSSSAFQNNFESSQQKLRIAIINSTDVGGGAEKIAFQLHLQLQQLGHDSKLFVEVKKTDLKTVSEIGDLQSQLNDFKPDVIHVHNFHGTSVSLEELKQLCGEIPVLFTLHDSWLLSGSTSHPFCFQPEQLNLLELKVWKHILNTRNRLVRDSNFRFTAPSQWMRELFFLVHGIRPYFVPNSVTTPNAKEVDSPSKLFMLFVANHPEKNPYKDFATLKRAWVKANQKLGNKGLDLVVMGGDARAESHGNFHIHFIEKGDSERVYSHMKKADILVQASKQDNAPLTILEAHSLDTKVVATLVGGIPELLSNQERAWLAEAGNADQLANSIISALNEPEAIVLSHPKVETMVKIYLGHYYDLISA